jgi:indolepyruvate ferredoxin oxidoreductase
MILLGYAWQRGVIPLSRESIEGAIKLNAKATKANLDAFSAGRLATLADAAAPTTPPTLDEFIVRRTEDLTRYWNAAYAQRYANLLRSARRAAEPIDDGETFVWAVARSAYKLMAYKDEYEVARLYADGRFRAALKGEFDGIRKVKVHLAPPLMARLDRLTGRPRKIAFGPWIFPLLGVLARCKFLREGPFDPFARSPERRLEQSLRDSFLDAITRLSRDLTAESLVSAIAIAQAPLEVRGFGAVKESAARSLLRTLRDSVSQSS